MKLKPLGERKKDAKLTVADCDRQAAELIRQAVENGAEWTEIRAVYPVSFTTMSKWLHKGDEHAEAADVPVKRRRVKKES